jgi:hypothetical protein
VKRTNGKEICNGHKYARIYRYGLALYKQNSIQHDHIQIFSGRSRYSSPDSTVADGWLHSWMRMCIAYKLSLLRFTWLAAMAYGSYVAAVVIDYTALFGIV